VVAQHQGTNCLERLFIPQLNNRSFFMQTIDIGINLINKQFQYDADQVIQRAQQAGVHQIILTGVSLAVTQKSVQLAKKYPNVLYATAGVHPHNAKDWNNDVAAAIRKQAMLSEVVAIGECGLDFDRDFSPRPVQESCFRAQLDLAIELQKPLFLHERAAFERFIAVLSDYENKLPKGVVHCFTGTLKEAKTYLDKGFYLGITGAVTDERRFGHLKEVLRYIPSDRLMIETDAPYMLPKNIKNQSNDRRNEPSYLPYVVRYIAALVGKTEIEVAAETTKTAKEFFTI
jgi:TatD DNase family protein